MRYLSHRAVAVLAMSLLAAVGAWGQQVAYRVEVHRGFPLFSRTSRPVVSGTTDAPSGSRVEISLGGETATTEVGAEGQFSLTWPTDLSGGSYTVEVRVEDGEGGSGRGTGRLVVQLPGRLPRRSVLEEAPDYAPVEGPRRQDFQAFTDRWRVTPPPYELNVPGRPWDPYHQNRLKGDYPIHGQDLFLVVTAVSDSLGDALQVPTPSSVSARGPGSFGVFGRPRQVLANQLILLSADLFRGDTAFKPVEWRIKGTLAANLNHLTVRENAVVQPDVRVGIHRTRGFGALQELFGEVKLKDLSARYDFVSLRVGIQPFRSDFRGFVFSDTNLGVRLFGNWDSNRTQFNLAYFERLEKDTHSGLNIFELRDQQVAVANLYRQDFLVEGYTAQLSLHYLKDEATFVFDKNGFLVRPDPVGSFTPHEIEAVYLGWAGFGHAGRLNLDHALYLVTGDDSLNPIAGPELGGGRESVDIAALMAAFEVSLDRNWWRPKLAFLYASGDGEPTDRDARGFDAIFDNPSFAGGGFSFWNRLGIRLAGTGVGLVQRGSPLPSLKSSREEGQPNFVNPGLWLLSAGVDLELTPELKAVATANYLRFDDTAPLELVLFQSGIREEIGWDVSLGAQWRPWLTNNVIVMGGAAVFLPGEGFRDIYERGEALFAAFADLRLTF